MIDERDNELYEEMRSLLMRLEEIYTDVAIVCDRDEFDIFTNSIRYMNMEMSARIHDAYMSACEKRREVNQ